MASREILSLDTATPQIVAPQTGDTYSAPRAVAISPESLTGSAATTSLNIAQTWNTTGTPTAFDLNVTDTASNASSLLMNLRVGGTSRFSVDKTGAVVISDGTSALTIDSTNGATTLLQTAQMALQTSNALILRHGNSDALGVRAVSGANDPRLDFLNTSNAIQVRLTVDAANTLAQRNATNPQTFNVYNTYTNTTNYERGFLKWNTNVLQIGTEKGSGGGTARALEFQTDGVGRWFVDTNGHFTAVTDNSYDIGASGANRPRIGYFGTRVDAPTLRTDTAYTVATLPAAGTAGRRAYVTDATTPTFLGALTGGGAVVCPVFDNGTAWVAG